MTPIWFITYTRWMGLHSGLRILDHSTPAWPVSTEGGVEAGLLAVPGPTPPESGYERPSE